MSSGASATVPSIVADPRRLIALEAAHNVRDLGGYRIGDGRTIAWGRLLRADGLHHLTPTDLEALSPLGLRTVIDLRTPQEVELRGTFPVEQLPVELVHLSVIDVTWQHADVPDFEHTAEPEIEFLTWAYRSMLTDGGDRFGEALRRLAGAHALPAIFHCAAGKDRTGMLAMLILGGLGAADDVIVGDYGLTVDGIARMRAWFERHHPEQAQRLAEAPAGFLAARPEAVQRILDELRDDHGGIPAYLATIGVDTATVARLADALTA